MNAAWRAAHVMVLGAALFFPLLLMYVVPSLIAMSIVIGNRFSLARAVATDEACLAALRFVDVARLAALQRAEEFRLDDKYSLVLNTLIDADVLEYRRLSAAF